MPHLPAPQPRERDAELGRAIEQALAWADQVDWPQALAVLRPWREGDPTAGALADGIDAVAQMYAGRFGSALPHLLACIPRVEQAEFGDRVDWLFAAAAYALGMVGDPVRGLEWSARALSLTAERPHSAGQRRALSTHGTLLAMAGDHVGAWASLRGALSVAEQEGNAKGIAIALGNLAYCAVDEALELDGPSAAADRAARARQALPWAERADGEARAAGLPLYEGFAATSWGAALWMNGQHAAALLHLKRAVELTAVNPQMQADALLWCAKAHRSQAQHEAAGHLVRQSQALAQDGGLQVTLGRVLDEHQALSLAMGRGDEALEWAQRSVAFWKSLLAERTALLRRHTVLFAELERSREEVGRLRQQSETLADQAQRDPLTGALNRRGLALRAATWHGTPVSVAALDVDHFKRINDDHGHALGDAVLQALAGLLLEQCRRDDVVVRLGGEEFLVVFPKAPLQVAETSAERLRSAIQAHPWAELAPGLAVTVSIGLAEGFDAAHLERLIAEADSALYAAKRAGRNQVLVHRA